MNKPFSQQAIDHIKIALLMFARIQRYDPGNALFWEKRMKDCSDIIIKIQDKIQGTA